MVFVLGFGRTSDLGITRDPCTPEGPSILGLSSKLLAIMPRNRNYNLSFNLFGHFPNKLGPETHSNGSGSKNGAKPHLKLAPGTNFKVVSWPLLGNKT